jgi:small subunit ribosomal protein S21
MRKLKKILKKSGLFDELKERRYYEKPSVKRRKKKVLRQRLIDKQNKLRKLEEERLYKPKPKRKKRRDR